MFPGNWPRPQWIHNLGGAQEAGQQDGPGEDWGLDGEIGHQWRWEDYPHRVQRAVQT